MTDEFINRLFAHMKPALVAGFIIFGTLDLLRGNWINFGICVLVAVLVLGIDRFEAQLRRTAREAKETLRQVQEELERIEELERADD